jgi:biopolymer transport protein ExbD
MKFSRNARIFRGRLDMAPFAAVFFLLVMFLLLASLVYTPGVRLQLPVANDLPGTDKPTVSVAIDANGRLYFENQLIEANELKNRLRKAVERSGEPLTLAVQADEKVSYKQLIDLTMLARHAGIQEALLATLPGPFSRAVNPAP